MNLSEKKCVLIINKDLPAGVVANIASVLSITLGHKIKDLVGPDIRDKRGSLHPGLTQLPIPVLGAAADQVKMLREKIAAPENIDTFIADFTTFAGKARTYHEYTRALTDADEKDIEYQGIAVFSDRKTLNKITNGLSLLGE